MNAIFKAQLKKLIPVHNLLDLTELDSFIGKELILVKLDVKHKKVSQVKELINNLGAETLTMNNSEIILQFAGSPIEISNLIKKLSSFRIVEQTRSGLVSMALGTDYIKKG